MKLPDYVRLEKVDGPQKHKKKFKKISRNVFIFLNLGTADCLKNNFSKVKEKNLLTQKIACI